MGFAKCLGRALFFTAVTCYTIKDLRDEVCRALCVRDGYAAGRATGKTLESCECYDVKKSKDLEGVVSLGYRTPSKETKRYKGEEEF